MSIKLIPSRNVGGAHDILKLCTRTTIMPTPTPAFHRRVPVDTIVRAVNLGETYMKGEYTVLGIKTGSETLFTSRSILFTAVLIEAFAQQKSWPKTGTITDWAFTERVPYIYSYGINKTLSTL